MEGDYARDNAYTWTIDRWVNTPGTLVTSFLADLNAGDGFAGHTDWRIPNRRELEGLFNFAELGPPYDQPRTYPEFYASCEPACSVTTCSCAATLPTWTSTNEINGACLSYLADSNNAFIVSDWKDVDHVARAVRTAF